MAFHLQPKHRLIALSFISDSVEEVPRDPNVSMPTL